MTNDVLTAFSPGAELLAIVTADGRVKIWDAGNGHLRGEFMDIAPSISGGGVRLEQANGHLAVNYTCIAWGLLSSVLKKGKKKGSKDKGSLALVLGTAAGDVLAWDAALGQLVWRTNDCNSGGVKGLAFSKNGQILYTAGVDGMISELNSENGEMLGKFRAAKAAISSLAISPDGGSLVAATSELKLFDLSSKKRIRKFAGHPAAVNALAFSKDGKYVLSSGIGERQLAVWQVDGIKSERGANFSLSLDNPPVALSCSTFNQANGILKVVAVSGSGVAYIWQASSIEELAAVKPMTVCVAIGKSSKSTKGVKPCILAAHLVTRTGEDSEGVLVAHGTTAKPNFEHVMIGAPGTNLVLNVEAGGALLPGSHRGENIASKTAEVTLLGPDNAADAVFSRPHVEAGNVLSSKKTKKKRPASDLEADDQSTQPLLGMSAEADDVIAMDADDQQTMEERLIALGIVDEPPRKDETVVPPRADSVQVLLSQALQADDSSLLERCLAVSDEKVINNTVRSLRPSEAAKFLSVCIVKLETRPRRGLALVPWVRAVLLQHAASLMSNPAVQPVLTTLYQLIEARLSVFRPLLALSGRLDLIMAQISSNESHVTDDSEAVVVYEEEESELEVEDVVDDDSLEESSDKDANSEDETMGSEDELAAKTEGNGNGHLAEGDDGLD